MPNKNESKRTQLEKIARVIRNCKICKVGKIGLPVPGEGDPNAKIVFIGEAPGKQEAKAGRPFVGPAGRILRKQIEQLGLKDEKVFITSPVKYLPKYVTPRQTDIEHGKKHLKAQLDIIRPKIIVLLGKVAGSALLDREFSLSKEHGTMINQGVRLYFLTYHPAAQLHSYAMKKVFEDDLKKLQRVISKIK